MRVTPWVALLAAGGFVLAPSRVCAQGGDPRPVQPNSGLDASIDAAWEQVGPVDGAQAGFAVAARFAPVPAFEIGAGWGARISWLRLDAGAARTRGGLPPARAWLGTGGVFGEWRLGARLEGAVGMATLDAADVSSNGEWAALTLVVEGAVRTDLARARVSLRAGAAYAGASAWSGVGSLGAGVELGPAHWPVRPFALVRLNLATDLQRSMRVGLGAAFELERSAFAITLLGPDGATGRLVELSLRWRFELAPEHTAP